MIFEKEVKEFDPSHTVYWYNRQDNKEYHQEVSDTEGGIQLIEKLKEDKDNYAIGMIPGNYVPNEETVDYEEDSAITEDSLLSIARQFAFSTKG